MDVNARPVSYVQLHLYNRSKQANEVARHSRLHAIYQECVSIEAKTDAFQASVYAKPPHAVHTFLFMVLWERHNLAADHS